MKPMSWGHSFKWEMFNISYRGIAQLVERRLDKAKVTGSSPVIPTRNTYRCVAQ